MRTLSSVLALLLVFSFAFSALSAPAAATDNGQSGTPTSPDPLSPLAGNTTDVPASLPASTTTYSYVAGSPQSLPVETMSVGSGSAAPLFAPSGGSGSGGSGGSRLGNAPESHYKNLQKFLAKGKAPPANYPVPYVIYTKSAGVETFTNAFTKQPVSIDVDNNASTGQGHKDIRVKTEISVSPLVMTTTVDRLGSPNPPDLFVSVTFPAFFYNGETNDSAGVPYWEYGYQTQPAQPIPANIQMNFTVDHSVGATHTFKFAWTSTSGIPHLGFEYGVFQVVDQNTTAPINPAFASFVVTSPPSAGLTFYTSETGTSSSKCMGWSAPISFGLSFGYDELRSILGIDYPMNVTVNDVPNAFSICTTEDRAAHTYAVDYTASANVAYVDVMTQIFPSATASVTIDLTIRDMPSSLHAVLGDGSLGVTVGSPVGMVGLNASANVGLAAISSAINFRMLIFSLPSFTATWGQSATGNFFNLDTVSGCIGRIELAFSYADLVLPAIHTLDPTAHYLSAYSDATKTTIALRLIGVHHIGFAQDNNVGSNTLTLGMCGNNLLYILVHSTHDGMLTPGTDIDLTVVMTLAPTSLSLTWTVPYVMSLTTNQAISSITADLTYTQAPSTALTAHAEIDNLPATTMAWNIGASGSISFTAGSPIGSILLTAQDPNGLAGAATAFGGQPIRMLHVVADSVPSFTGTWSSSSGSPPNTGFSFTTAPSTALGDLTFVISTSLTDFVALTGPQANRAMLYSDDTATASMVSSVWLHVENVDRAAVSWGGTETTITVGFGTSVSGALRVTAQIDPLSGLNPVSGRAVTASLLTTPLPTSMDLTVRPASGFTYSASGSIAKVTLDLTLGESPDPSIDVVHGEIEGIPSGSSGTWGSNAFAVTLSAALSRVLVTLDNDAGVFGTSLKHILVDVHGIPQSVSAAWDTSAKTATLSFVGPYSQGLGEFKLLATTGDVSPTNAYITGLGTVPTCFTDYGTFTQTIDTHYWPSTVPSRLNNLYCRNPSLDTGTNDYGVYRTGGFDVYALRVRELALLDLNLNSAVGHVTVEFSRGVVSSRPLYFISDDTGGDNMVLGRVSELPNGLSTNSFHVQWDQGAGKYSYAMTQVIPAIDAYIGQHDTTSLTSKYTKLLLVDVPATASFDYSFGNRAGHAYFDASNVFEAGILVQDGSTRYVGYVQLESLHFDYSFALPGEESCSLGGISACFRVFRFDTTLNAIGSTADGILGIYTLSSGLAALTEGTIPRAQEYIPEWTFIMDNFSTFQVHVLWDVGIGFSVGNGTASASISLLPTITVVAGVNLAVDFFWNDQVVLSTGDITIPLPVPGCIDTVLRGTFTINTVKDYIDQNPLHVWPVTGGSPITWTPPTLTSSGGPSLDDPCNDWHLTLTAAIDIPGFHDFSDHPTPF